MVLERLPPVEPAVQRHTAGYIDTHRPDAVQCVLTGSLGTGVCRKSRRAVSTARFCSGPCEDCRGNKNTQGARRASPTVLLSGGPEKER